MVFLQQLDIKRLIQQYKSEGLSMRLRLVLYLISALVMLMSLILLLLNYFGILNPVNRQIMDGMEVQLSGYARDVERVYDKIAAYAISFAEQMETEIQNYLSDNGITFADLENDTQAITDL